MAQIIKSTIMSQHHNILFMSVKPLFFKKRKKIWNKRLATDTFLNYKHN